MALSVKVVEFNVTGTGSTAITGVGFQPKLVIIAAANTNASTTAATSNFSFGAATSSSARWSAGWRATDNAPTMATSRVFKSDKVISQTNEDGNAAVFEADFTSMDADGFTINVGTHPGIDRRCVALCLGGTDLDVAVGTFQTGTTTGANISAVTGLSFQPKAVITSSTVLTAGHAVHARAMLGLASGASNEWVSSGYDNDNSAASSTAHAYKTDAYLYLGAPTSTVNIDIDFNTFNSDGWDHNITTAANDFLIGYIALGGTVQFYVGNAAQKTSTGTNATTGVGFEPSALITAMGLRTTSGVDLSTGDFFYHVGFMTSTAEVGLAQFSDDNTADSEVAYGYDATNSVYVITDDATPTVPAQAKYSAFGSDGFTLDWVTADATARLFGFLAIGAAAAGIPEGSGNVDGIGSLVGEGQATHSGSGEVSGVGSLVGDGLAVHSGSGTVDGIGSLVGEGEAPAVGAEGSGTVGGIGSLVGAGESLRSGSGTVDGIGSLVGEGQATHSGSGAVDSVGLLVGEGLAPVLGAAEGSGVVGAVGSLVGEGYAGHSGSGAIDGVGSLEGAAASTAESDSLANLRIHAAREMPLFFSIQRTRRRTSRANSRRLQAA